jgi:sugar lactone lactonase YvrE
MTNDYVVTDGRRRYRVRRDWSRLPDGREFGWISQLAVDRAGAVIAVQRSEPAVLIFAPDGRLDRAWHHPQLPTVHGVFACADGDLLICSFDAHQILRFDRTGRLIRELGRFNEPSWNAPFNHPTGVFEASDGEIYVSDGYGNSCVHRFAAEGRLIRTWGAPGVGPGEFSCPHGIWITPDERVVVLDRDNSRIQLFDREGTLLDIWTGFVKPMGIWGNAAGELYVADQTPRIVRLDRDGRIVGAMRGFTVYPHGLGGDPDGNLFIAEQLPSGVAKYELMG